MPISVFERAVSAGTDIPPHTTYRLTSCMLHYDVKSCFDYVFESIGKCRVALCVCIIWFPTAMVGRNLLKMNLPAAASADIFLLKMKWDRWRVVTVVSARLYLSDTKCLRQAKRQKVVMDT